MGSTTVADSIHEQGSDSYASRKGDDFSKMDQRLAVDMMRQEMFEAAENLDFERAAQLRDEITKIEKELEKAF
jgi:excinuclease ABC subunit B